MNDIFCHCDGDVFNKLSEIIWKKDKNGDIVNIIGDILVTIANHTSDYTSSTANLYLFYCIMKEPNIVK